MENVLCYIAKGDNNIMEYDIILYVIRNISHLGPHSLPQNTCGAKLRGRFFSSIRNVIIIIIVPLLLSVTLHLISALQIKFKNCYKPNFAP